MLFVCGCLKGTIGVLGVVFSIVVGIMGKSHNPFVWLRYPVSTYWPCLKTWSVSLLNRARQLSLQSFPIDRRFPVWRLGRIWPVWDRVDSAVDSGIVTRFFCCYGFTVCDADFWAVFCCCNIFRVFFGGWVNVMG